MNHKAKKIEGKTKVIIPAKQKGCSLMTFKNVLTAQNGGVRRELPIPEEVHKGELACSVTDLLMTKLEREGIPTHLVRKAGSDTLLVKTLKMIPLEVVVRFKAAGSYIERHTNVVKGAELNPPVIEFFHKGGDDPLITRDEIMAQALCSSEHFKTIKELALEAAEIVRDRFQGASLVDIKFEFGFDQSNKITLGDEISPDNFRLHKRNEKGAIVSLDKDVFRDAVRNDEKLDDRLSKKILRVYKEVSSQLQAASG